MVIHAVRPAVFLDRDGVIVIPEVRDRRSYPPRRAADFKLYPEAAPSLRRLKQAGFLLAVITNQPDVGHGLIARSELDAMHEIMASELPLDVVKACCHRQEDLCVCRKPKPHMIIEAANELSIDLPKSFMIGDRRGDIEAGCAAGCATVFIDRDYAEAAPESPDHVACSIAEAADIILEITNAHRRA